MGRANYGVRSQDWLVGSDRKNWFGGGQWGCI